MCLKRHPPLQTPIISIPSSSTNTKHQKIMQETHLWPKNLPTTIPTTMTLKGSTNLYNKLSHRRRDSDELDVFEAARYFSGGLDIFITPSTSHKAKTLENPLRSPLPTSKSQGVVDKQLKENKSKQPASPGGRLARMLNSLFNQTASSSKKKSKSNTTTTTHSKKDESLVERRSSISGSCTAPTYSKTYHSCYKKCSGEVLDDKKAMHVSWFKTNYGDQGLHLKEERRKVRQVRTNVEVDDGGDSDSSSDLFELKNYDLGGFSSGLPVYGTTHMEGIKRGKGTSHGAYV
ncbi:hypothetical protein QJS04_geneDACA005304 [Acorus gramineus]|uniref:Protein BIG GRAIN 1-like E n=1 Tax=Acorus gramineus TaxID=55184 RepID=A0AAV9AXR0_ACOGR|nr:hypothetical protein QJS04_geneDACA005304 [Acorus gramineus]